MSSPPNRHSKARALSKVAPAPTAGPGQETLRATVTELIPAYGLVHVETEDGRGLALTERTAGIELASLRVGQAVDCVVTLVQPRVVRAQVRD